MGTSGTFFNRSVHILNGRPLVHFVTAFYFREVRQIALSFVLGLTYIHSIQPPICLDLSQLHTRRPQFFKHRLGNIVGIRLHLPLWRRQVADNFALTLARNLPVV